MRLDVGSAGESKRRNEVQGPTHRDRACVAGYMSTVVVVTASLLLWLMGTAW